MPTLCYTRRHLPSAVPWISEDRLLVSLKQRIVHNYFVSNDYIERHLKTEFGMEDVLFHAALSLISNIIDHSKVMDTGFVYKVFMF